MNGDTGFQGNGTEATEPRYSIRPPVFPTFWRVFIVFWFVWTGIFVVGGVAGGIPIAAVLVAVALLLGLGWFLRRRPQTGIDAYENELVIRDAIRERRVPRAEIAGFRIGTSRGARAKPVVLLIRRDGAPVPLWVTAHAPLISKSPPTEKALDALTAWLNLPANP